MPFQSEWVDESNQWMGRDLALSLAGYVIRLSQCHLALAVEAGVEGSRNC